MSFAELWQQVRSRWQQVVHQVWPDSPEQEARVEATRLAEELTRRQARLVARRQRIERLRDRLAAQQRRLLELSARLLADPADAAAQSLPALHRAEGRNRERLAVLEQGYERQRVAFERRRQLHRQLVRGEVKVVD